MILKTASFQENEKIPVKFTNKGVAGGENVSPELSWDHIPAGTKSLVIVCVDRFPAARNWIHWMVINVPVTTKVIKERASGTSKMPFGAKELINSFNQPGYGGPQPPQGSGDHEYVFILYAVDLPKLDIKTRTSEADLLKLLEGHILGQASVKGYFGR